MRKRINTEVHFPVESQLKVLTLSSTFSRKLNMSLHGGAQYETADFSETITVEVPESISYNEAQKEAHLLVKEAVISAIKDFDLEMQKPTEKSELKKETSPVGVDLTELEGIKELLQDLLNAKTKEELAIIKDKVMQRQDLSQVQLSYLKTKFNQKAKVL